MKKLVLVILGITSLTVLQGCADLLSSLREESAAIDRESDPDGERDAPMQARAPRDRGYRGLSANNVPSYGGGPYRRRLASLDQQLDQGEEDSRLEGPQGAHDSGGSPPPAEYRRATRQDFVDKDASENSLWDGQGQGNFLFAHNRRREPGDLITADVEKELKREIQYQLWLTLPPELRKSRRMPSSLGDAKPAAGAPAAADASPNKPNGPKASAAANAKSAEEKNKDAAEEAAKTNLAGGGKDEDNVRMEVAESLGNGLVRVVGQKRVIYRGVARLVEVTALVNGKDVDDSNRVKSSAFLDTKAQVIQ